jgi:tetratricopeptide (TPR) repeat protein
MLQRTASFRRMMAIFSVVGVLSVSCATRTAAPPAAAPAIDVTSLIRRGCYSCLEQAMAAGSGSFEAAVLLALRSKELGLPFAEWAERARALVPAGPAWETYLEIAASIPADPLSADRDVILAVRRPPRAALDNWRNALASGPASDVFRAYLDVSLACGPGLVDQRETATAAVLDRFADVPLLQYRAGVCGRTALLHEVLRRDADFADVNLELGRAALQRERPDYDEALRYLDAARQAFPASATVVATIGNIHLQREEWPEALATFEATLALVPTHRDALLGKVVSLSHLSQHEAAVASASLLLELGNWFVADAHYWRAWNEYRLGQIPAARADVDRARILARDAPTLVLSGIIAWRERRLDAADADFQDALNLDFGQCEAASYLGGVRAEQRRWQEGLAAFRHAAQCFELAVITRRKAVAELTGSATPTAGISRQLAAHERAIAEAEARRVEAVTAIASIERRVVTPYTGDAAAPALPSP